MSEARDTMIAMAKTRAGYGLLDSPCAPSRSAYVDGTGGDDLFFKAQQRWWTYRGHMLSGGMPALLELTAEDLFVLGCCPVCYLCDGADDDSCSEGGDVIRIRITADHVMEICADNDIPEAEWPAIIASMRAQSAQLTENVMGDIRDEVQHRILVGRR